MGSVVVDRCWFCLSLNVHALGKWRVSSDAARILEDSGAFPEDLFVRCTPGLHAPARVVADDVTDERVDWRACCSRMECETTSRECTSSKAINGIPCYCALVVDMLPRSVWTVLGSTRFPRTFGTTCLRIRRSDLTTGSIRDNLIRSFVASLDRSHLNKIGTNAWNCAQAACSRNTWSNVLFSHKTVSVCCADCGNFTCAHIICRASLYMSTGHPAGGNHTRRNGTAQIHSCRRRSSTPVACNCH